MSSSERALEAVLHQIVGAIRIAEQRSGVSAEPWNVGQEIGAADHAAAIRPSAVPHSTDIRRPRLGTRDEPARRPVTLVNAWAAALFRAGRLFSRPNPRPPVYAGRYFQRET